jgi:DNA-binding FadR family transcriptional regulator
MKYYSTYDTLSWAQEAFHEAVNSNGLAIQRDHIELEAARIAALISIAESLEKLASCVDARADQRGVAPTFRSSNPFK